MIREDEAAARETPAHPQSAEQLAQLFHETYERLALEFGYRTREASAKPWADVPAKNKALMIAVCAEIVKYVIEPELARLQVAQKLAEQQHRAAINELEEFRSDCIRLRAEHDRDLFNLKASNSDMWHELREVLGIPLDDVKWFPSALVHQVGDLMERVEKSEAERDGLRDAKPKYAVGVSVLLTRGNQLLLGKRKNISAAGLYSTPGGRIEPDEDMARCAIREFHEETGAVLGGFTFIDYCEHTRFGHHYFMFYAHATDYEGEIVNTQPDKCEGWEWIDLNRLPGNCTEPPKGIDLLGRTLAALSDPPEGETR